MESTSFFQKNRKLLLYFGIPVLILALLFTSIIIASSLGSSEPRSSTASASNKNGNYNSTPSAESKYDSFLPANVCPDKLVEVNGNRQAEYKGKLLLLRAEYVSWIDLNCADITKSDSNNQSQAKQVMDLECTPRTHEYYRTQKAFAIDPKNPEVMYLGVEYKGVFKTVDGGKKWEKITDGISAYGKKGQLGEKCYQEFGKIVIDPNDSKHILISRIETPGTITDNFSENAGVWESFDGGKYWKQMVSGTMNASGSKGIAIDPRNPKVMYYGVNNSPASYDGADKSKFFNTKGILYKTMDGGKTWTELDTGIQNYLRVIDLEFDPKNPNIIYLGNFHSGTGESPDLDLDQSKSFLVSKNAGSTWTSLSSKLPSGYQAVYDVSISSNVTNNMFIVSQPTKSSNQGKSFFSTDGGNKFTASNKYIFLAEYDPFDTTGKNLIGYNPFDSSNDPFQSKDAGKTWTAITKTGLDGNKERVTGITFDQKTKGTVYLNANGGIVMKSTDNGKSWSKLVDYQKL